MTKSCCQIAGHVDRMGRFVHCFEWGGLAPLHCSCHRGQQRWNVLMIFSISILFAVGCKQNCPRLDHTSLQIRAAFVLFIYLFIYFATYLCFKEQTVPGIENMNWEWSEASWSKSSYQTLRGALSSSWVLRLRPFCRSWRYFHLDARPCACMLLWVLGAAFCCWWWCVCTFWTCWAFCRLCFLSLLHTWSQKSSTLFRVGWLTKDRKSLYQSFWLGLSLDKETSCAGIMVVVSSSRW